MGNLYIVGNGFDVHHGLNTEYCYYRRYLENKNSCSNILAKFPGYTDFWTNIEEGLAIDYQSYIDAYIEAYNYDQTKELVINQNLEKVNEVIKCDKLFRDLDAFTGGDFYAWLAYTYSEGIVHVSRSNLFGFKGEDFFVTFNYTRTLEEIYNIKDEKILHIHGLLMIEKFEAINDCLDAILTNPYRVTDKYYRDQLDFGNPQNIPTQIDKHLPEGILTPRNPFFDGKGLKTSLSHYMNCTYKNVPKHIEELKEFLISAPINDVIILGHSFLGIDSEYYSQVLVPMFQKCNWYIYCHDDKDEQNAKCFAKENNLKVIIKHW